ncbi:MAG TPA: hypothetical protein VKZ53_19695 [Candidatus Angelobacter sp.]|nr:hypothetical protein [Candidatus Angelobacter sp.]
MRKQSKRLIIEPLPRKSRLTLLVTLAPLEEELSPIHDPHPKPVEF